MSSRIYFNAIQILLLCLFCLSCGTDKKTSTQDDTKTSGSIISNNSGLFIRVSNISRQSICIPYYNLKADTGLIRFYDSSGQISQSSFSDPVEFKYFIGPYYVIPGNSIKEIPMILEGVKLTNRSYKSYVDLFFVNCSFFNEHDQVGERDFSHLHIEGTFKYSSLFE